MDARIEWQVSDEGIAVVQMKNGENRMRLTMTRALCKFLDQVESNAAVKALVITGHGKFFCLGRDLDFLAKQDGDYMLESTLANEELYKRLLLFPVPTVAVLNGHAFGGGAMLAICCDYRVMRSDRGWLSWPESAMGMRFRPVTVGLLRSKFPNGTVFRDAILFSKKFTATEAKRLGLIDVIADESRLMDEARRLIKEALGKSGLDRMAVVNMKQDVYGKHVSLNKL